MQAAAVDHLHSPIQGEQGSASRSSMWPVLVLGILTAIIAWVWYRGGGEEKKTESPVVEPTVTPERALESEESERRPKESERRPKESERRPKESERRPKESEGHATGPERCEATSGEQEVPCPESQEKKVLNPEVYQPRCEQQPKLEVQELPDVEHPKNGSEGPSSAAATTVPSKVQEEAGVPELQGPIQKQENHVPKEKGLHGTLKEHLPDLQREEEAQAHAQEHLPDLQREEAQAHTQEHLPDLQREEEAQAHTQEHLPDLQREEEAQAHTQEHLPDLQREEEAQAHTQGHLPALQREEEAQAHAQERLPDLQREEEAQAHTQEHLPDLQREEEAQAHTQEHLSDTSEKDDELVILVEHQTSVPGIQDSLLKERLKDVVQATKEFLDKNDDLPNHEGDMHPCDNPEVRELLSNGDEVYPPLKKEVAEEEYPQNVDQEMVQANEDLMAEQHEARRLLVDSCQASKSEQGKECVRSVTASQDGVYVNGEVEGAEPAAGYQQDNSFVKENAVNVLEAKKNLTQDLERIHTSSDDGNTIVANPFATHESVEKCDVKRMCSSTEKASIALEDNADVCVGISNESSQEGLLHFQKLEAGPEASSVDVFNFMSKQEKNLPGLGSTNTDEKTSFGGSLEANTHEIENQKARKVATIQPLPPQNVDFAFRVHYITHSDSQIIAVTGDHEKLGKWEAYVPLTSANGGFWTHSINLPADTALAWKFVMVENGKIKRWEECNNRFLQTAHEDIEAQLYWGYP